MKLIDRYLLATFFTPFFYVLVAFCLLYVIFDLFENLTDFLDGNTPPLLILRYYAILLPSVAHRIVPISLFLAVLYALSHLTKNNELTAMRACGISMGRIVLPFLIVGLIASLSVAAIQETVGPRAAYWCRNFVREQRRADPNLVYVKRQLAIRYQDGRRSWLIGEFDTRTYAMRDIEVTQQREDLSDEWRANAKEARWLEGRWWFRDGSLRYYDVDSNPIGPPRSFLSREMAELTETPEFFLHEVKEPEFLTSRELATYLEVHSRRDPAALARIRADLHFRIAEPWTCLVVMMLGIPFGAQTGRKGALRGIALAIALMFSYYVVGNVALSMAKNMVIPAPVGAWIPNGFFALVGTILLARMR